MIRSISTCVIFFMSILVILYWLWQMLLPVSEEDDNGTTTNNGIITDDIHLSFDDRIALYQKTFAANGNQVILTNEHLIVTPFIPGEGEEKKKNESSTVAVAIDIELGDDNNGNNSENTNDVKEDADVEYPPPPEYCQGSNITTSRCQEQTQQGDKKRRVVTGTCIICLEEFKKEEVIVWSADAKCTHIYHQDCMVNYLASNSLRCTAKGSRSILNVTNPCPTCRRHNYCSVRKEDVLQSRTRTRTTAYQSSRAVLDSPVEETTSASTTVGSDNNSSTNNVTTTTTATATTTNTITMITTNDTVTLSEISSETVS